MKASQIFHLSTSTKVGSKTPQHFLLCVSQFCHFPTYTSKQIVLPSLLPCYDESLCQYCHHRRHQLLLRGRQISRHRGTSSWRRRFVHVHAPNRLAEWAAFDSTSMSMLNAQGDFGAFVPEDSAVTALAEGSGKAGKYMTTSTSSTVVTKAGKSGGKSSKTTTSTTTSTTQATTTTTACINNGQSCTVGGAPCCNSPLTSCCAVQSVYSCNPPIVCAPV